MVDLTVFPWIMLLIRAVATPLLLLGAQESEFEFQKITTATVNKPFKSLDVGKSPGYDGIQDKFI